MKVAIIGAGLAGLACATRLAEAGHAVVVYDKGRVPGGWLAARTMETDHGVVSFDYGAQYFTARDPGFRAQADRWAKDGVVAPWPAAGNDAWVGTPHMSAPALALADNLDVHSLFRAEALRRDKLAWLVAAAHCDAGPFDSVVLALPAEQARTLIMPWDAAPGGVAARVPSEPCWTVMATFVDRVPITEDAVRGRGILDWAARNSSKPGRSGSESWVMHATAEWSRLHLEEAPDAIGPHLLCALTEIAGSGPAGSDRGRGTSMALCSVRPIRSLFGMEQRNEHRPLR